MRRRFTEFLEFLANSSRISGNPNQPFWVEKCQISWFPEGNPLKISLTAWLQLLQSQCITRWLLHHFYDCQAHSVLKLHEYILNLCICYAFNVCSFLYVAIVNNKVSIRGATMFFQPLCLNSEQWKPIAVRYLCTIIPTLIVFIVLG